MPLGANKVALFGASADTGTSILLSTATASSSASLSFTLPTAYKQVTFGFYNITPATDSTDFSFQVNASGQTGYNETITSTYFRAIHNESDTDSGLAYLSAGDQAQGTAYQKMGREFGSGADECGAGELHLFDPASPTYVKQFYSTMNVYRQDDYSANLRTGGYINNTAVISEIDFKMSSGNIASGTIKMWGVL